MVVVEEAEAEGRVQCCQLEFASLQGVTKGADCMCHPTE